ncbi:MAG: hypothetical protein NT016_02700 [Candidatus Aenigmarchaeota archaeon]|nr:hypothetical protein [Candidatus Aenigmarchaeota archaeon]
MVANVFETVVSQLVDVGFYNVIIFVLALSIFYSVLKRVKIFGESNVVIGAISFSIAFLIFGYPVIIGYSLVTPFVAMFTQTTVFLMVFVIAFLIASFFYPDMPKFLAGSFTSRGFLMNALAMGIAVAIMSGAIAILWQAPKGNAGSPSVPTDISIMAAVVIVMIIVLIIASAVVTSKS